MISYDDNATANKICELVNPNKRAKIELDLILLLDEVGLTEILKDRWSSSDPKERLDCLDYY